MKTAVITDLRARASAIRARWEALLSVNQMNQSLANPDALAYLIPHSLEETFLRLGPYSRAPFSVDAADAELPKIECGHNPYWAYFIAGEQALTEELGLLQTASSPERGRRSDLAELIFAVRRLARCNIDAFCGICVCRGTAHCCRHAAVTGWRS